MFYKKHLFLFLIVFISLFSITDLFRAGLPLTHDGQDHVARIANFYQNLSEGNIIPRWAGNLNWGYGHPILEFLYPLPSYFSSFFHFLGFSIIDSVKIVFGMGMILSGISMYLWLSSFLGKSAGFIGGILYMFAPYRFVDMYVRGAIGEHIVFVFLPLTLYFIWKLSKRSSYWYIVGGSFSVAGLILSHNAIALMFLPLILLYAMYLTVIDRGKKRYKYYYTSILVFGFGLASFFWMPAFFEGKYTLRDIVTKGEYASRFVVDFKDFIYGPWNYGGTGMFTVQVGIVHWLLTLISFPATYFLYKKKDKLWVLSLGLLIIFAVTLFIMMPYSKIIWEKITTLQKFQFPWRFLSVTVFATSVLGAVIVSVIARKFKVLAVCLLLIAVLFLNKDYWHAQGYFYKQENFFTDIYNGTTDTGESAPIWSVRFMEKRPKSKVEVISGKAEIREIKRTVTTRKYKVLAFGKSRILENTLYFPGWSVFVNGSKIDIEFQDPQNRGLITFFVEKGEHNVYIEFKETKLRLFSSVLSLFSILVIVAFILKSSFYDKKISTR